jgi:hypothetical protein
MLVYFYTLLRGSSSLPLNESFIFAGRLYYPLTIARRARDSTDQEPVADAIH